MRVSYGGRRSMMAASGRQATSGGLSWLARRAVAVLSGLSLAVIGLSFNVPTAAAVPPFPLRDNTQGPTGALNPNWLYARNTGNTTGNTYTSDGWLRLTNATKDQATNILNPTPFPSDTGFRVTFDYRQAGGTTFVTPPAGNGQNTGDGIAMYLVYGDERNQATNGGPGAGLGYATQGNGSSTTCLVGGVAGGYLGLGLDVYGNFASPQFGSSGGNRFPLYGGSEIGLRGSGGGCGWNAGTTNVRYPWVNGVNYDLWTGAGGGTTDPANYGSSYRRVSITVVPSGTNVQVTVAISGLAEKDQPAGPLTEVFSSNLSGVYGQSKLPPRLQLGFSASTGNATDYHDIRNIEVAALTDAGITKALSSTTPGRAGYPAGSFMSGDPISFTLTATNHGPTDIGNTPDGVARVYDDLSGLPISNVSWTCAASAGAACANGSGGTGSIVSQDWTGAVGSSVTVTVNGTVSGGSGSYANTAILPTDFVNNRIFADDPWAQKDGATIDTNLANNTAVATFDVVALARPHFTQTKTADATSYVIGQPITYTIVVTNDGSTDGTATLSDVVPATVAVADVSCVGAAGGSCTASHSGNTVSGTISAPAGGGATFTITGSVVAGPSVANTAVVTPVTPGCEVADSCGGGDGPTPPLPVLTPGLSLTKTALVGGAPATGLVAGQTITYQFVAHNSGATLLNGVSVVEGAFSGSGTLSAPSCPAAGGWTSGVVGRLGPGDSVTCTATYVVTQADVDAGALTNTATAAGTPPGVTTPVVSPPATAELTEDGTAGLTVTKMADASGVSDPAQVGDVIVYTIVATNNGGLTLHDVSVTDALPGLTVLSYDWPGAVGVLAPRQAVTVVASYTVTPADLAATSVVNLATATARDPHNRPLSDEARTTTNLPVSTPAEPAAELSASKTADLSGLSTPVRAGDVIVYTITAENTGEVELHDVAIGDALPGLSALTYTWPGAVGVLAPGETVTASANYSLTQADLDGGVVVNTAVAQAKDPQDRPVDDDAAVTTELIDQEQAGLTLSKSADVSGFTPVVQAGDLVAYTITATNTGDVTLHDVSLSDALPGLSALTYFWPGAAGVLAPDQTVTATATYPLTQADLDAGSITNAAIGTAKDPRDQPVSDQGEVTTDLSVFEAAGLALVKTVDRSGLSFPVKVGDALTYTLTVTNSGDATIHAIAVSDELAGVTVSCPTVGSAWPSGTVGVLAPAQQVTCSAVYALTQADIVAGRVVNTAQAAGLDPRQRPVSADDSVVADLTPHQAPHFSQTKTADAASYVIGQAVTYTITVTNDGSAAGSADLRDVVASTVAVSAVTCAASPAAVCDVDHVGDTVSGTVLLPVGGQAVVTVTGAVVAGPSVANTVVVTPDDPRCQAGDVCGGGDGGTGPLPVLTPALSLTKIGLIDDLPAVELVAGQDVSYHFIVSNTGQTPISQLQVIEGVFSGSGTMSDVSCPTSPAVWLSGEVGLLGRGDSITCTADYTVTQDDVDAGSLSNTATAEGLPPAVTDPVVSPPASTRLPAEPAPALTVLKTADLGAVQTPAQVGDVVAYRVTVTNTGNVVLRDISVTDELPGMSVLSYTWPGAAGVLRPGQTATVTATYALTQADLDAAVVENTAVATGTPPATPVDPDPAPLPPESSTVTSDLNDYLQPGLTVVKTADDSGVRTPAQIGDVIVYTIVATNSGDVTLRDVSVSDALPGLSALSLTWPGTAGVLAPGQSVTATATYAVGQADVDAGAVVNTAVATGMPPVVDPANPPALVSGGDSAEVDVPGDAGLRLGLTVTAGGVPVTSLTAGQTVRYHYSVENTGTVTVSGLTIATQSFDGSAVLSAITCPVDVVAPGETVECVADYTVTQADVDAGQLTNTAIAHGVALSGLMAGATVESNLDAADLTADPVAGLTVVKTADLTGLALPAAVGDVIGYTITVTNSGEVSLANVSVTDELAGLSGLSYTWPGAAGVLEPGQTVTVTASYALTQADLDAATVENTAWATGTPPATPADPDPAPLPPVSDTVTSDLNDYIQPGLTVVKSADESGLRDPAALGDVIIYTIEATNAGNVTLDNVSVSDALPGLSGLSYTWPGTAGLLAPGQTVTATASYALTQADLDAGWVVNSAMATATPPLVDPANPPAPIEQPSNVVSVDPAQRPGLALVKTGGLPTGAVAPQAGDIVTYQFVVINTGNVSLTGVTVADAMPGLSGIVYDWPGLPGVLAPAQTVTATADYAVTQADVDAAAVANSATVSATPPLVDPANPPLPVTADDATEVALPAAPALRLGLTVTADGQPVSQVSTGQLVRYIYSVQNTGNVTVSGLMIDTRTFDGADDLSDILCPTAPLAPGQTVTCSAGYRISQTDVNVGAVTNAAVAQAVTAAGAPVESNQAAVGLTSDQAPGLALYKSAALADGATGQAGDVVTYRFEVTNTGNVTLTGVTITDHLVGLSDIAYRWQNLAGVLAPGEQAVATAIYVLTQADVDAGGVHNQAVVSGLPQGCGAAGRDCPPVDGEAAVDLPVLAHPGLTVTKSADQATYVQGTVMTYSFTLTNTGNVTLTDVKPVEASFNGSGPAPVVVCPDDMTLVPTQQVVCQATYTATQADVAAGRLTNTAVATGALPDAAGQGTPDRVSSAPSTATVTVAPIRVSTGGAAAPAAPAGGLVWLVLLAAGLGLWLVVGVRRVKGNSAMTRTTL